MDRFAQILYDLGKEMGVDLYPDQNRICQLNYRSELHIQLKYEENKQQLVISTFLCEIPPGKYREKILRAGLISNQEYPRIGTLSYCERKNQLTLFEVLFAPTLKGGQLLKVLLAFIEKGKNWKEAIERGGSFPLSLFSSYREKGIL